MIKVDEQQSITLHMHKAHGAVASRMQSFNVNEEGGKESLVLRFSDFLLSR